jgi:YARHG domain
MDFEISTSWIGDVYADIETEMLPRLKSVKLSVEWSGPGSGKAKASQRTEETAKEHLKLANAPLPQPSSTPKEERAAKSETEDLPASTESQPSTVSTAQSVEVRSAEPVMTPTIDPPQDSVEIPSKRTLNGERYPQTRRRLLTLDNIKGLSAADVQYAINEIYARNGASFHHPDVRQQFQQFDWYSTQTWIDLR